LFLAAGTDHRGTADVDVLDDLLVNRAALGGRALERVEVHAHQVHELDGVLLGGAEVLVVVAYRQQPRVELGVQRLDPAVHDLGEAGELEIERTRMPFSISRAPYRRWR
jgi:hypothetical protein